MKTLKNTIRQNYFQGYSYSYPHKSAYRPLERLRPLKEIWQHENKQQLFLYIHIPFCEMRCGFCNLFTIANPKSNLQNPYIKQLQTQAEITKEALGEYASFSRVAIGGGTPSFLAIQDLEQLFSIINNTMGANTIALPTSVESSPKTINKDKLQLLAEKGTTRLSIGVQSFLLEETKALGRPQKTIEVQTALQAIKDSAIPEMNIDLIYGMAGQTRQSWQYSLEQSIGFDPEEIFLYPLYVRPLTGLGLREQAWNDHRLDLYRFGRDFLCSNGYEQVTMRIFRRKNAPQMAAPPYDGPTDGMVGLGVGARSYTQSFHYSSEYAVGRKGIKEIIHDYNTKTVQDFGQINYGVTVELEEQKRRYVIKSLLEGGALNLVAYQQYFGSNALEDLPQLEELYSLSLVEDKPNYIQLNTQGLALSDVIGPWLYSDNIQEMMQKFDCV